MNGSAGDQITIRTAVAADLPELQRIYRAASLSNSADAPLLLSRPEFLVLDGVGVAEGRTRVAVARPDGQERVLGFATLSEGAEGEPELDDLFVDPPWHRRGVARRLVLDAVQTVGRAGRRRLWVTGNPHALAFYSSTGFAGGNVGATALGAALRLHLDVGGP